MNIVISVERDLNQQEVIALYKSNKWSAADKPTELFQGLMNSHALITAREDGALVGLGNAISDGSLVVYFPHLLVHPNFQGRGIGKMIMAELKKKYTGFHMQMLVADGKAINFYHKEGFVRAGKTESMWIYRGNEH